MSSEAAETIALKALGWLAGNEELMSVFLGSTGTSQADLRERAGEPEFLGSVLDFLLLDDQSVMAVSDAHGWEYTALASARAALPGGDQVHWT